MQRIVQYSESCKNEYKYNLEEHIYFCLVESSLTTRVFAHLHSKLCSVTNHCPRNSDGNHGKIIPWCFGRVDAGYCLWLHHHQCLSHTSAPHWLSEPNSQVIPNTNQFSFNVYVYITIPVSVCLEGINWSAVQLILYTSTRSLLCTQQFPRVHLGIQQEHIYRLPLKGSSSERMRWCTQVTALTCPLRVTTSEVQPHNSFQQSSKRILDYFKSHHTYMTSLGPGMTRLPI